MVNGFSKTPRYILKDGAHPTSPIVVGAASEGGPIAIYGFSGKPTYDIFWKAQAGALTPFPLVSLYLQHLIDSRADSLSLVALDATGPQQQILQAATFQAVLEAYRQNSESVPVTHQLIRDGDSPGYRVEALQDHALGVSR